MSEVQGQISMFNMIPEDDWHARTLRQHLKRGMHGWSSSRIRIYTAAERLDRDRFADYLQNEYGTCGGTAGVEGGAVDYNFRGAFVYNFRTKVQKHYAWHKVRNIVLDLINSGEYLTAEDWEQIEKIKAEHGGLMPLERPYSMSERGEDDERQDEI